MEAILEYIMLNYTWIIAGSIIILLAIIGSYADKTNFGQGKDKIQNQEKDDKAILEEEKENEESENPDIEEITADQSEIESETQINDEPIVDTKETAPDEVVENLEETFEKFDKEFDELVPKKEIIDDDLLDEINNLSLDKTQKINLTDIPDLDDVELPKIKSMPKEEDIWKF